MIKLHIGCGWRNFGEEWTHIDGGNYPHIKYFNVKNFPYKDNSVDLIYNSHIFEYFDREEGLEVLKEWFRVLKPKGKLRIAVPDFGEMAKLYIEKKFSLDKFLGPIFGKMEMGANGGETGRIIYHKTTYDFTSLKKTLEKVGFKNIRRYDWRKTPPHNKIDDHSQCYIIEEEKKLEDDPYNKKNGYLISLNLEAEK